MEGYLLTLDTDRWSDTGTQLTIRATMQQRSATGLHCATRVEEGRNSGFSNLELRTACNHRTFSVVNSKVEGQHRLVQDLLLTYHSGDRRFLRERPVVELNREFGKRTEGRAWKTTWIKGWQFGVR